MEVVGSEAVALCERRVPLGELTGKVDHHVALLDRRVVFHLAVQHDGTRAVAHGIDDLLGVGDLSRLRGEHLLGDVDLHRVQRPRADATEQVGVAELVLARHGVLDVANGP